MHYEINTNDLFSVEAENIFEFIRQNRNILKAICSLLKAGDVGLTQIGYDRLDDSLKKYFTAKTPQKETLDSPTKTK